MKIAVFGTGGVGGYFGARLAAAGERRVRERFSPTPGIDRVAALLKATPARKEEHHPG